MIIKKIVPGSLSGEVVAPPSKSVAHRAIIVASLAEGVSNIYNVSYSDDILATINVLKKLGIKIIEKEDSLEITGVDDWSSFHYGNMRSALTDIIEENGGEVFDCKESASTLRFLLPLLLIIRRAVGVTGSKRLFERPLDAYFEIFDKNNILYHEAEGYVGLYVSGRLDDFKYHVSGDVSSQFISGLLMSLPARDNASGISVNGEVQSKNYVELTEQIMRHFGYQIMKVDQKNPEDGYEYLLNSYHFASMSCNDLFIEGDYSQAAFFLSAAALGHKITVKGLYDESLQGDKQIIEILQKMGATVTDDGEALTVEVENELIGTVIDASLIPDIIPILALVASVANGETRIINAKRLRIKECDRLKVTVDVLNKLGADITELDEGMIINGNPGGLVGGVTVDSHNDHRIAMMLAIAGTICKEPILIKNAQSVSKSYPNFFEVFDSLMEG